MKEKCYYDLEPLEREFFEVLKKYDMPIDCIDDAMILARSNAIRYFNVKHESNS